MAHRPDYLLVAVKLLQQLAILWIIRHDEVNDSKFAADSLVNCPTILPNQFGDPPNLFPMNMRLQHAEILSFEIVCEGGFEPWFQC